MQLTHPFLQLPKLFCAETLAEEVRALPASAWVPHPGQIAGNDAVLLVTPSGEATNDFAGAMAPTEHLLASRYIMEVMAQIGGVWGRSRLMGLAAGAEVPVHVDINYYWRTHIRIHIPIVTSPEVLFTCGGETVHMAPGECWIFDSFRVHRVHNGGRAKRVHLVLDTVGGEELWNLMEAARTLPRSEWKRHEPAGGPVPELAYERENVPTIMSPWEIRCHIAFAAGQTPADPRAAPIFRCLDRFAQNWAAAWARFGPADEGIPEYQRLIARVRQEVNALGAGTLLLPNRIPLYGVLYAMIFRMAVPGIAQKS